MRPWREVIGWQPERSRAYVALLAAPLLLTIWRYRGMAEQFVPAAREVGFVSRPLAPYFWQFGTFFLLMCVLPIAFLRGRPPRPLRELGLRLPDPPRALALTVLATVLVVVPAAWLGAQLPDVRAAYPMLRLLAELPQLVVPYEVAYALLYYVAWEFFFRGYLLFTLEAEYGAFAAVLMQTVPSCLVHLGKPEAEILGSIPVGILFGVIAIRTRSIWPSFLLHASLGVMTDLFVLHS